MTSRSPGRRLPPPRRPGLPGPPARRPPPLPGRHGRCRASPPHSAPRTPCLPPPEDPALPLPAPAHHHRRRHWQRPPPHQAERAGAWKRAARRPRVTPSGGWGGGGGRACACALLPCRAPLGGKAPGGGHNCGSARRAGSSGSGDVSPPFTQAKPGVLSRYHSPQGAVLAEHPTSRKPLPSAKPTLVVKPKWAAPALR